MTAAALRMDTIRSLLISNHIALMSQSGQKLPLTGPKRRFRFASINGRQSTGSVGQFRATTGREQMQQTTCANAAYSITSSARTSSVGGTVSPSVFAVLRLMVSSYLVGPCTGRLAGFSPLRMRSI
jgi:hypothetical protein